MTAIADALDPPAASVNKRISLADMGEKVLYLKLDAWQKIMCAELEKAFDIPGYLYYLHAPPQWGKSQFVSILFVAWLLGMRPDIRIGVFCYDLKKSREFVEAVRDLMQTEEYKVLFPNMMGWVSKNSSGERLVTPARSLKRDAQASVVAGAIASGQTGKGFDIVIVDDPYASPKAADSKIVNENTINWFKKSVMGRKDAKTSVICAMHRYHAHDLGSLFYTLYGSARRAIQRISFICHRFCAIADENQNQDDPTGRAIGELLSPRMDKEAVMMLFNEQAEFARSYYQGDPGTTAGLVFHGHWFDSTRLARRYPLRCFVRAYDVALGTATHNDYTSSALGGFYDSQNFHVYEMTEDRIGVGDLINYIHAIMLRDPPNTIIAMEESNMTLKFLDVLRKDPRFAGKVIIGCPVTRLTGGKRERAMGWASYASLGKMWLLDCMVKKYETGLNHECTEMTWVGQLIKRVNEFKNSKNDVDDMIDALSFLFDAAVRAGSGTTNVLPSKLSGSFAGLPEQMKKILQAQYDPEENPTKHYSEEELREAIESDGGLVNAVTGLPAFLE